MALYYILFFWSMLSGFILYIKKTKLARKIYLLINFVPLILFVGLRDSFNGRDTEMYIDRFSTVGSWNADTWLNIFEYESRTEYGYGLLNWLIFQYTHDAQVMLFIVSLLTFFGVAIFLYRNSSNLWMSVIIYYATAIAFSPMNTMRQDLAVAILLCGYSFLREEGKKRYLFFLFVLLGSCFQRTVLVFMLLIFFMASPNLINAKRILKYCFFILVFVAIATINAQDIVSYVPIYSEYLDSVFMDGSVEQGISSNSAIVRNLFLYMIPSVFLLKSLNNNIFSDKDKIDVYYCCIFLFLTFALNIVGYSMAICLRFAMMFDYFTCIAIPLFCKTLKGNRIYVEPIVVVLWGIYFILKMEVLHSGGHIQEYIF